MKNPGWGKKSHCQWSGGPKEILGGGPKKKTTKDGKLTWVMSRGGDAGTYERKNLKRKKGDNKMGKGHSRLQFAAKSARMLVQSFACKKTGGGENISRDVNIPLHRKYILGGWQVTQWSWGI